MKSRENQEQQKLKTSHSFINTSQPKQNPMMRRGKTGCHSLHLRKVEDNLKNATRWQLNKRRKKLIDITKKYQNQLIISMETCKQSLSFSVKQTERLKESVGVFKKANILFDYTKYCTSKSIMNFCTAFQENDLSLVRKPRTNKRQREERKTVGQNFMARYENVSQELYQQFKRRENRSLGTLKTNKWMEPVHD